MPQNMVSVRLYDVFLRILSPLWTLCSIWRRKAWASIMRAQGYGESTGEAFVKDFTS